MKFTYKAFDRSGNPATGAVEAHDSNDASENLRRQGLYVLDIKAAAGSADDLQDKRGMSFGKGKRLKNMAMFTRQLYVLVATGTRLVEALAALERQARDPRWKKVIADVRAKVEEGASLSAAMGEHPEQFDAICRGLTAAGESGGNLDVMLDRLATLARKRVHVRSAVIGAMVYPALLIVVAVGVLITMMTFVLPRFTMLFQSLDTPLPPTTQMLMTTSGVMVKYWWLALLIASGAGAGIWSWLRTTSGQHTLETIALKIPRLGGIIRSFSTAQITRLLGILLQGHVPLMDALALTRESTSNHHYVSLLAGASEAVKRGESLASVFAATDLVNPSVYEAMRSGDKSGQLGPLLTTIADFLDEENEVTLRSLTSILEPMILIVLGVFVGFIAFSLFMPLFDLTAATGAK